ncbi:LytTR family DNA-binding domain-containing protein [Xanthomonas theicola]|uniref:HTH LytTR-type domain-containing protein n=1 Tax=Xanthomonas theicola TaxID=56464 RepID=A0A2S6ZF84_9XANT|nr:LytTR family DNA-binding domain-containing protein [Xanthomonas theicola]PPT90924.1 hypothetical protein XthCFBP4691_10030 [Xanthomonas theicola]QNH23621.1 response regulator transcription factor [Xanthomonas theicola]
MGAHGDLCCGRTDLRLVAGDHSLRVPQGRSDLGAAGGDVLVPDETRCRGCLSRGRDCSGDVRHTGGATLIRTPTTDILAARAADNYVEFMLAAGRRPLMRVSLTHVEARLSSAGIVRTHRSWLANTCHVRSITPAGSGDFRLDLGHNLIVPLSRRYPTVLASLKAEPNVSS